MKFPSLLLTALFILTSCQFAAATLRTVTSTNDTLSAGTLRSQINASINGDSINFAFTGIIYLTNELDIGRTVSIDGPGAGQLVVSGNLKSRVFNIVNPNATVQISGLTIAGGSVVGTNGSNFDMHTNGQSVTGGGILNSGNLTLTGCSIVFNSVKGGSASDPGIEGGNGFGGGVYSSGPLTLLNCTLEDNSAQTGSALGYGYNGDFSPAGTIAAGGGIFCSGAFAMTNSLVMNNSTVVNEATFDSGGEADGGGLHIEGSQVIYLVNCTVAGNFANGGNADPGNYQMGGTAEGGGVSLSNAPLTMISCTVYGNSCLGGSGDQAPGGSADGGGIFALSGLTLHNTIVAGNSATLGAGTEFDGAPATSAVGPDCDGTIVSAGHNLIGATDGSTGWVASDLTGTITAPLTSLLGPLQDNGGPTLTMAPQPGSAAIDNGDDSVVAFSPFDQRGSPRLSGAHVDIGAFELNQGVGTGYVKLITTTSNLLGYWRFDPTFQANSCVNGYTGTLKGNAQIGAPSSGAPLPVTPSNQGLLLDGTNSYLQTSLTGQIGGQGTILAWVYLTSQPSTAGHYFNIASQSQVGNDFDLLIQTDNHLYFYTDNGTATVDGQPLRLNQNQWHFLAATFVTNTSRLIYVDGQAVASSAPGAHALSNNPFTIGASYVFSGRYFAGRVSDVAVYNRALSPAEIAAIYAASSQAYLTLTPQPGKVVLSWQTNNAGYTLQQNTNLAATTAWATVPGTPSVVGQQYVLTNIPAVTGKNFFRLSHP